MTFNFLTSYSFGPLPRVCDKIIRLKFPSVCKENGKKKNAIGNYLESIVKRAKMVWT